MSNLIVIIVGFIENALYRHQSMNFFSCHIQPDLLSELYGHSDTVSDAQQSINGELISASTDETIKVWDYQVCMMSFLKTHTDLH